MKKIVLFSLVLVLVAGLAFAQATATDKEVIALVDRAAAYVNQNGTAKAFAEFNKKDGAFSDSKKSLYVFAFDMKGKCLSHGENPALIGRDLSALKDKDGKYFIKEFAVKAQSPAGSGWIDYQWTNPATKKIAPKATYVKKVSNDLLVGSGFYR